MKTIIKSRQRNLFHRAGLALALLCLSHPALSVDVPLVDRTHSDTSSPITRDDIERSSPPRKFEDIIKTAPSTSATLGSLTVPINTSPQNLFCLDGMASAGAMSIDEIKNIEVLMGAPTAQLGSTSGQIFFVTHARPEKIREALAKTPMKPCPDVPIEPDFCTIMTPLSAFRGHDHAHHQGHPHDHDAPDPPLSWGLNPPDVVIRLQVRR